MISREEKMKKIHKKCQTIKPEQIGVCKFVEIKFQLFDQDENGKWIHTGMTRGKGLQYENKVKLINGRMVYINKKGTKVIAEYEGIPVWATKELEDIFVGYDMFDIPVPF